MLKFGFYVIFYINKYLIFFSNSEKYKDCSYLVNQTKNKKASTCCGLVHPDRQESAVLSCL